MKNKSETKNSNVQKKDDSREGDEVKGVNSLSMILDVQTQLENRFLAAQNSLSSSRQRLIQQILNEPQETFFLSSREMGRRYGVDTATIVRTIQAMGYKKFADFAHDLREHFVTQITPYTAMRAATQTNKSIASRVNQSLEQDFENLSSLKATLNHEKVVELAKQIHRSQRIIVVGVDFAAGLAMLLTYGLVRLGSDAETPIGHTGTVQGKIKLLTKKDLLIAFTFGRGLRETVEAVQRAKEKNVPTFGITDSTKSPLVKYCDQYLIAPTDRSSFLDSYVAPISVINAILVACAHIKPKRALEWLEQSDKEYESGKRWFRENT
jgi:DNA-binding MurR/RpiR family transcriptional regulator